MQIRHVCIDNFRGIRELRWSPESDYLCLIGPGDSTKSTILNALDYALSSRWQLPISDADFHKSDTEKAIVVEVTIGDLDPALLRLQSFADYTRGYDSKRGLLEDPDDDAEEVLTIRLTVDDSLVPDWTLVKRPDVERRISWRDRAKLGVVNLDSGATAEFTWARGSALARLTEDDREAKGAVARAHREARAALAAETLSNFDRAAKALKKLASRYGVELGELKPGLDASGNMRGLGPLCLFEDNVPIRLRGEGSRRLAALAAQQEATGEGGLVLADEIELALEPHRIRRLLHQLWLHVGRDRASGKRGQVLFTSHSPTVVLAIQAKRLGIVGSSNGVTTVTAPKGEDIQRALRTHPHAAFARRVVVCEGKTEVGLLRAMDSWETGREREQKKHSFAYFGCALVNGEGRTHGPVAAVEFARLGYSVLYFGDSDKPTKPSVEDMRGAGVRVAVWDGAVCTEQRVFSDMPWAGVESAMALAAEKRGEDSVVGAIAHQLGVAPTGKGAAAESWIEGAVDRDALRGALGNASLGSKSGKRPEWFKDYDAAQALGQLVFSHWDSLPATDTHAKLTEVSEWIREADGARG